jgi:hypothetical protein
MLASFSKFAMMGSVARTLPVWREEELMALLQVLFLGVALGMSIVGLLLVLHFLRVGRVEEKRKARRSTEDSLPAERFESKVASLPSRWLAVRHVAPPMVQQALGLHNPALCTWEEGVSAIRDRKLFISPPVGEWVLVFGSNLPDPAGDVDKCFRFLLDLSHKLGEVQFFSLNRQLSHHAWVHIESGYVHRAYAWAGKTLWNQGRMTRPEMELGLRCYEYAMLPDRGQPGQPDPMSRNTEKLPLLASRWSIDPASINPQLLGANPGITGELSRSIIH